MLRTSLSAVLLAAILLLGIASVHGLSAADVSFDSVNGQVTDCLETIYSFATHYTPATNDGDGYDYFVYAIFDGDGTLIKLEGRRHLVSNSSQLNIVNIYAPNGTFMSFTTSVITVAIYDLPSVLTADQYQEVNRPDVINLMETQGVLMASLTFDLTSVNADCASLPASHNSGSGAIACPVLPSGSVVGALPNATRAYYRPGDLSTVTLNAGTYWVIGTDESGAYYKVMLSCAYLWVPIEAMQPSYQSPQSGTPLPTRVVS